MKKLSLLLIMLLVLCGTALIAAPPGTTSPAQIRADITALELELATVRAAGADYQHLKLQLNELYAALPARDVNSSLDQGGETCADTVVISGLPYCDTGSTANAIHDYAGTPDCSAYPPGGMGPDVVYSYRPAADEVVTFSLCGSSYDTYLHVYMDDCPGSGRETQVCCNDDDCDLTLQSCCPNVSLLANETYYIIVDGWGSSSSGDYELWVSYESVCGPCPAPPPEPIVIPYWPLGYAECHYLTPGDREILICGGPLPPSSPDVSVTPGCDPALTRCFDPNCVPAFTEPLYWYYDPIDHCWHGILSVLEAGCVCVTYDGWFFQDTCYFPYDEADMGDLEACNYGTQICNPSHGLSGIAWLGAMVNGEPSPNIFDLDIFDDGVNFDTPFPWYFCTPVQVTVTVTGGPNWPIYELCEGQLFLNAWKDGNLDYDFCDEIPCADGTVVSEWVIQDAPVLPGIHTFTFMDPGVDYLGYYPLQIRFRLTSAAVGRYGHSMIDTSTCPNQPCGTFGHDMLGEVEDYSITNGQFFVELLNFNAISGDGMVTLQWATASETDNDYFEILRDNDRVGIVDGAGTRPTRSDYIWTDEHVTNGRTYTYSLVSVDMSGVREVLGRIDAAPSVTSAEVTEYALYQNFPNPFNATTNITFDLTEENFVTLKVYNLMGQEVVTLVSAPLQSGRHTVRFDAAELPSAVYLYRLEAGDFTAERKLVLIK